jgi:2-polyprenyl-3-methyl-5-hydroxy-6-metoxy-1,4-benzoquinol methylase
MAHHINYPTCPICNHPSKFDFSSRDLMFNHHTRYDYAVCTNCDLVFQTPQPSDTEIASFYPSHYDVYDVDSKLKRISSWRKSRLKTCYGYHHLKTNRLLDFINLMLPKRMVPAELSYIPHAKMLDVGCGNGRFMHGMSQLGWEVQGVEFNAGAVNICRSSGLTVHHGDLFSANLESASFDIVHMSHVIEHVTDPLAIFKEIARILKPNGLLLIKTPNSLALGRLLLSVNWYANEVPRHLFLFSEKNIKLLAENNDFSVESFSTHSTPKIFLNSIDYALHNTGTPSKYIKWRRCLARLYVIWANYRAQGDEINLQLRKH